MAIRLSSQKVKTAIYQKIIQDAQLQEWFLENYNSIDVDIYVWESGSELLPAEIKFPAIRYKLTGNRPYSRGECNNCGWRRLIDFDIYVESVDSNTRESDELIDIVKDIFLEDCGRGLGSFTGTAGYIGVAGSGFGIETWDIEEVTSGQFRAQEEPFDFTGQKPVRNGKSIFSYVRFVGAMASED